VSQQMTINMI